MNFVTWKTAEVDKVLGTRRVQIGKDGFTAEDAKAMGASVPDDGKMHTIRTGVQKVPYEYPAVSLNAAQSVETISAALAEILTANKPGFTTWHALIDYINFGLYNSGRGAVARGADMRYTQAQRNAIKMFCDMVAQGLLDPAVAANGLLRQGISDAQELVEAVAPKVQQNLL